MILLALALLRFGTPSAPLGALAPRPAAASPARSAAPSNDGAPASSTPSRPQASRIASPTTGGGAAIGPPLPASGAAAPAPVVLLLHPNAGTPTRDDAAMAAAFSARANVPTRAVPETGSATQCSDLLGLSHVFVSTDGIEPPLRDCLLAGGAVVVAYDALAAPAGTGLVSTRRPLRASIADIARLDRARLAGRVGIVSTTTLRPEVDAAADELRRSGVDLDQIVALPEGADGASVLPGAVLAFQRAQVDTVVFAAPVDVQSRWVALSTVVSPGTRFVVVDAYDAVLNETYPPAFDGAIAVTSVRAPWADRGHATAVQDSCTKAWEAAAVPPITLDADEQLRVYEWCQHLDLVAHAGTRDASALADALRQQRVPSPLTSDLGPLGNDAWGPVADAELQWHANCRCWEALRPFQERTP